MELAEKYFDLTDDPEEAEAAVVFITSPDSDTGGYSIEDRWTGGNGYIPITLQYNTYKAVHTRTHSIAADNPVVDSLITDRSYRGKEVTPANTRDLTTILDTRTAMDEKPVIVVVNASKPFVVNEFEREVDGLLIRFGVSDQAVLNILTGAFEPTGLLPVQFPADMQTVEEQAEDVPHDMEPHVDSQGNRYDFGFGLNWS
ncbi:MAG: glycoside hydrolase family 3 C-terminal domain-containing protein [Bacteroides sp.]|nr:glycoside hydrolase family 3 C-terminal domain-containing protein [Bacteroides sp.]